MGEVEIALAVRTAIGKHARWHVPQLGDNQILTRDLGFDSLALLLAVTDVEERLGFNFPVEEVSDLQSVSVGDVVRLALSRLCGHTAPAQA